MDVAGIAEEVARAFSAEARAGRHVPLSVWVESSKPHMCVFWIAPPALAATCAALRGAFDPVIFVLELVLCWLFLTLSCFADEFGDLEKGTDNEARLGPITPMQRGLVDRASMIRALVIVGTEVLACGLALVLYSFWRNPIGLWVPVCFIAVGALCIWAAYAYTMGEHAYGYVGLGDFAAFAAFGIVAVGGGFWLHGHEMWAPVLLSASGCGLLLASTISLNNIRDIENDEACGKVTLAVRLGLCGALLYHGALVAIAVVCFGAFPVAADIGEAWRYVFLVALIPLAANTCRVVQTAQSGDLAALKPLMKPLAFAILVSVLAFCACMLVG